VLTHPPSRVDRCRGCIYNICDMRYRSLIDRRNYAQQVYEALRHEIITLQLVPGQRIEINMVAERFSVSATPVREALKQLAERGLLQVEPNVHYRVVSLDEKDIEDIFSMRELLESYALKETMKNITDRELEALYSRYTDLLQKSRIDFQVAFELDVNFHGDFIIGKSNNKYAQKFFGVLYDYVAMLMHANKRERVAIQEHLEIIEAMRRKDCSLALLKLREHLKNAKEACLPLPKTIDEWQQRASKNEFIKVENDDN